MTLLPLLEPRRRRRVRPLDRVADARGRHVVYIRISTRTCRMRWTLKKTDVNANALHAADARSILICMFSHDRILLPTPSLPVLYITIFPFFICFLLPFILAFRGAVLFFFTTAFWVFTCTIPSHTSTRRKARTMNVCFFYCLNTTSHHPPPPR